MSDVAVKVQSVTKEFVLPHQRVSTLKSKVVSLFRRFENERQLAVNDVSFEVKKGEFFGIVGRNGSGKSTLLKCMAGVYAPNKGGIKIEGTLVPFIELGVGFNPELSGRDNVYLNGALFGFGKKQMDAMYKDIVEFAELEDFMDQSLKNYSSGMQVRLAFSIAIRVHGDILLLDEVLAVGDVIFQQKCFNHFHKLKKEGKTVLFVSHDINALRQYCTNGVLLENGQKISEGPIETVLNRYVELISQKEHQQLDTKASKKFARRGTGKAYVDKIDIKDAGRKAVFSDQDKEIVVRVEFKAQQDIESPVLGIVVRNVLGESIMSSNSLWHNLKAPNVTKGKKISATWRIPNIFNTGEYFVSPAIADSSARETYDWVDDMASFKVRKKSNSNALVNPAHKMELGK